MVVDTRSKPIYSTISQIPQTSHFFAAADNLKILPQN